MSFEMKPVESSQIHSIGHDPDTSTLHVRFKGKNGPGSLYTYSGVSPDLHAELIGAENIGQFFGANIKSAKDDEDNLKYPFTKVVEKKDSDQ